VPRPSDWPRRKLEIWLAKNEWPTGVGGLVRAGYDDPELAPILERLTSEEAKRRLVVEWYCDQRHEIPMSGTFGSVYDTRGMIFIGSKPPEEDESEALDVNDDQAPAYWGRLPPVEDEEPAGAGPPKTRRPRHRPPDPIPEATVKQLKWELAQRRARPRDPELSQEKIARRRELDRSRIQQAEALERIGWDLLRSHPEFSALDGFVHWPSAREAARILASERAEN
jgi:hypothetical protein